VSEAADRIDETRLRDFYEEVGEKYPEEEVVYNTLRGKLRKKFVLDFVRRARGRFLDVGCNTGVYIRAYRNGPAIGVDLAFSVLKKARARLPKGAQNRVHFVVGSAENLFFLKKSSVDSLICSEVLEHLFHPQRVFDGFAHVLRPGGQALLTTPNYRKTRPQWIPTGELKHYTIEGEEYFHTAYRPEELAEMALKAGLQVMEVGTLEWEVKYATKIPVLILWSVRAVNRLLFKSARIESWNQQAFEKLSNFFYFLGHMTGIEKLLRPLIKEGVRSYIIVTPGQQAEGKHAQYSN
jgi:SAM-dependent methyltransferase